MCPSDPLVLFLLFPYFDLQDRQTLWSVCRAIRHTILSPAVAPLWARIGAQGTRTHQNFVDTLVGFLVPKPTLSAHVVELSVVEACCQSAPSACRTPGPRLLLPRLASITVEGYADRSRATGRRLLQAVSAPALKQLAVRGQVDDVMLGSVARLLPSVVDVTLEPTKGRLTSDLCPSVLRALEAALLSNRGLEQVALRRVGADRLNPRGFDWDGSALERLLSLPHLRQCAFHYVSPAHTARLIETGYTRDDDPGVVQPLTVLEVGASDTDGQIDAHGMRALVRAAGSAVVEVRLCGAITPETPAILAEELPGLVRLSVAPSVSTPWSAGAMEHLRDLPRLQSLAFHNPAALYGESDAHSDLAASLPHILHPITSLNGKPLRPHSSL